MRICGSPRTPKKSPRIRLKWFQKSLSPTPGVNPKGAPERAALTVLMASWALLAFLTSSGVCFAATTGGTISFAALTIPKGFPSLCIIDFETCRLRKYMKRILIFQTAFIGDLVLVSSLIKSVAKTYSEAEVFLVCKKGYEAIYEGFQYLKGVIPYDKKGIRGFASKLKSIKFDAVFSPHRSHRTATLLFLSGIPLRVGFDTAGFSFLYTRRVKYKRNVHEVERNIQLLLAVNKAARVDLQPELFVSKDEVGKVREKFSLEFPFAVIAPGSVWSTKRWLPEYFASVGKYLIEERGLVPVIVGSAADIPVAEKVFRQIPFAVNTAGKTNLRELMALIAGSSVVITNDSSPTHFASAFKKPVVTMFGPTVKEFGFYPLGEKAKVAEIPLYCRPCGIHGGKRCREGHFKCMRDLTPEKVFPLIDEVLKDGDFAEKRGVGS
ncbi:lipopolysaccharide heptosyltransferase II [Desulfurobacterium sp.]